eukprot:9480408-Pyramimonas_sp.AAC.1
MRRNPPTTSTPTTCRKPLIIVSHAQRLYTGGAHQETICFWSGYPGLLRSARCAVTSRNPLKQLLRSGCSS